MKLSEEAKKRNSAMRAVTKAANTAELAQERVEKTKDKLAIAEAHLETARADLAQAQKEYEGMLDVLRSSTPLKLVEEG
jgi:predicted  nucleic acid-binding Zn-ribbon protein